MKINFPRFNSFLVYILIGIPVFSSAQTGRGGTHCAVQKSPYRLSMDSGKMIYTRHCLSCHQSDGQGVANISPPLDKKIVSGDRKNLIEILIKGQIKKEGSGEVYQHGMIPDPEMKNQEIADVLTYIRNSFGNKASVIKVSEVESARSALKQSL
jgi:mono/diheme cytochrome c family protein